MSTAISSESGARARLSRPPEPRIVDCYSHAWDAMVAHLPLLLVLGLIVTAVAAAGEALTHAGWILWPLGVAFGVFVTTPFKWGFASLSLRAVRGWQVDASDMFAVQDNYREVVIAGVLCTLMVIAGFIALVVPGVFLYCRLRFVPYLVVNEELEAVAAIQESYRLTSGLEWPILGITLIGMALSALGTALALVGLIPALILWDLALASLYHAEVVPAEPDDDF